MEKEVFDINFCSFTYEQKQSIATLFKYTFQTNDDFILKQYDFFKDWFCREDTNNYITPFLRREHIVPQTIDKLFLKKYNSKEYWVGVDYPILLTKKSNKKNVLIVAEDPLRNFNDDLLIKSKEHVLLSTPFATHLSNCRKALKEYWGFHNYLLEAGYNVYVTDIHKLWLKKERNNKKEVLPSDLIENFKKIFQFEMEFIKPELVVTYGNTAKNALNEMRLGLDEKVLHFLHPSNTANGSWKKLFLSLKSDNIQCTSENKIDYMSKMIKQRSNNHL